MGERFTVEISRLPSTALNPNQVSRKGGMWWAYAEAKKEDGELAAMQARTVRLPRTMPWDNVYAHVHFVIPYVKSRRLRDWDNLIASCKGFWDGLVRTGVLTDDNMDVIQRVSFSAEYKQGREAATLFELERIES